MARRILRKRSVQTYNEEVHDKDEEEDFNHNEYYCKQPTLGRGKKKYQCHRCLKRYKAKTSLITHVSYQCGQIPRFSCPYCGKGNHQKILVIKHVQKHHSKQPEAVIDNTDCDLMNHLKYFSETGFSPM